MSCNLAMRFLPFFWMMRTVSPHANDWANGFIRGMDMRRDGWSALMDDEEHGGACSDPSVGI